MFFRWLSQGMDYVLWFETEFISKNFLATIQLKFLCYITLMKFKVKKYDKQLKVAKESGDTGYKQRIIGWKR